jgi:hypothetical protein
MPDHSLWRARGKIAGEPLPTSILFKDVNVAEVFETAKVKPVLPSGHLLQEL